MSEIIETPLTDVAEAFRITNEPSGASAIFDNQEAARTNAAVQLEVSTVQAVKISRVTTAGIVRLERKPVAPRPRIFITPAILAAKKAEAVPTNPVWKALYDEAVRELPDNAYNEGLSNVRNLLIVYLITGEVRFADKAILLTMAEVAKGPAAYSRDSGYDTRSILADMAVVYDWGHARLTPEQKTAIRAHVEGWCEWILQPPPPGSAPEALYAAWAHMNATSEVTPDLEGRIAMPDIPGLPGGSVPYSWNNPANNYWMGHLLGLWLCALALGEDSPLSPRFLSTALSKWRDQGLPYYQGPAAGGWLHEGTSYGTGTLFRMVDALTAHLTATGEDLFPDWVSDALLCKIHATSADSRFRVPMGDQAGIRELSDYDRASFLTYQSLFPNRGLSLSGRDWLYRVTPTARRIWFARWRDFLWPAVGHSVPMIATSYHAKGAGYATARTDWTPQAAQLSTCAGDLTSDHGDKAAGEFRLSRGSDVLISLARETAHDGIEREADHCNCVTFLTPAGLIQRQWSDRKVTSILAPQEVNGVFTRADELSDCYRHPNTGSPVTSYQRHIVWRLAEGILLVYDRIVKKDALTRAVFHINAPLSSQGNTDSWTVGESGLVWSRMLSSGPVVPVPQMLGTPAPGTTTKTLSSYDMQWIEVGGTLLVGFLSIFQYGDKNFTPRPVRAGNAVVVGDAVVWMLPGVGG